MDLKDFTARYRTARTPVGEIAYVDIGSGPVVLFVHGVSVNSALWRRVIGTVSAEFRCLAIDLPLHGRSPARSDHNYSLSRLADGLRAFLDTIGVNSVHLVGNDSGGAICQVFAAGNWQRLRSLVLTNSDTRGNIPPPTFARTVELARQGRMAASATRWIGNLELARSNRNIGGGYRDPKHLTDEAIRHFLTPTMGNEVVAREFERFLVMALREEDLIAAEPSSGNSVYRRPSSGQPKISTLRRSGPNGSPD